MTRIFENPAKGANDDSRVWANLDPDVYNYFFRKVLAGSPGTKQAIINIFFKKFHEACLEAKIAPEWGLESELEVKQILNQLNFNGPKPTRSRRTNNSASKHKTKSLCGEHAAGGTH